MADEVLNVAPAGAAPVVAPLQLKMETVVDANGRLVYVQAITFTDEQGRPMNLLTERTGLAILEAIKALHVTMANANGDFMPTGLGLNQSI